MQEGGDILKQKDIRFDSNELLYLYILIEDDLEDLREDLSVPSRISEKQRAESAFGLSYAERIFHKLRAALKEIDPDLLKRYESQY